MSDVPMQNPIEIIRNQIEDQINKEGLVMSLPVRVEGAQITFQIRIVEDGWSWVNE